MSGKARHEELWRACHVHGLSYETWTADDLGALPQCYSCRWYHELAGVRALDWGVCFNPDSPRAGLLCFEHMGCHQHEPELAGYERTAYEQELLGRELDEDELAEGASAGAELPAGTGSRRRERELVRLREIERLALELVNDPMWGYRGPGWDDADAFRRLVLDEPVADSGEEVPE
jgi:hypothetical protein